MADDGQPLVINVVGEDNFYVTERTWRNEEQQQRRVDEVRIDIPPMPEPEEKTELLNLFVRWYFFIAGQWFAPVERIIKAKNLPRRGCRIVYAVWQAIVVLIMWSFFLVLVLNGSFQIANSARSRLAVPAYRHQEHDSRIVLDSKPAHRTYIFFVG